jgi:FtsH-binding integral membrane protein
LSRKSRLATTLVPIGTVGGYNRRMANLPEPLQKVLAPARIISFAMAAGLALVTIVALVITKAGQTSGLLQSEDRNIAYVFFAVGFVTLLTGFALGNSIRKAKFKPKADGYPTPQDFQTGHVVSTAMLEGPGLVGALGLLLTGFMGCLVVVILAIALILINVPSERTLRQGY